MDFHVLEPEIYPDQEEPAGGQAEGHDTQLVPRKTVAALVAQRNKALALFEKAYDSMATAKAAHVAAFKASSEAAPGVNSYNWRTRDEKVFLLSETLPERSHYLDTARRLTDVDVWSHIIEITELESLMDKEAKDAMRQELHDDPPEVTEQNVFATLERFAMDSDTIFKRGVANVFSKLDRRFRSHDGWKIGSRVILENAFDEWGSWSYHRNHRDSIIDIERAFFVLDGLQVPASWHGLVYTIDEARRKDGYNLRARQSEIDSEFFKIRIFKNGNCHLWFKRDDLVRKVNKLLAEYYGEVIPEEREPDPDTGLNTPKTTLARHFGFYPSPPRVVADVIEAAMLYKRNSGLPLAVLEPSAGTGNLALPAAEKGHLVDCCEVQPAYAQALKTSGGYRKVWCGDFLGLQPGPDLYDRVVMNPPFDRERDIDHVMHALKFLKPQGCLVAVMSAGTEFRGTRKSEAFRKLMEQMNGKFRDLPAGAFSEVGTNVNTLILKVYKDGRSHWF